MTGADQQLAATITALGETANLIADERNEARRALRRILGWRKYRTHEETPLTDYEQGANDAIDTLADLAREALENTGGL